MARSAKKCEKDEKTEKVKLKKVRREFSRIGQTFYCMIICFRLFRKAMLRVLESMQRMQSGKRTRYIQCSQRYGY